MYESAPWRSELKKLATVVREAPFWPFEEVPFDLERSLFYSAIVLRKLIEDKKLTEKTIGLKIPVQTFKAEAPEKSSFWRNRPGSIDFDFETPDIRQVRVFELSCQIIHFLGRYWWSEENGEFTGVLVCSYRSQDDKGYLIPFDLWAGVLEDAANDWPDRVSFGG